MFVSRLRTEVPKSLELIFSALVGKEIKELNVSDNALGPIGVSSIKFFFRIARSLRVLSISNNGLGPVINYFD